VSALAAGNMGRSNQETFIRILNGKVLNTAVFEEFCVLGCNAM
jgi:hypothetical protein